MIWIRLGLALEMFRLAFQRPKPADYVGLKTATQLNAAGAYLLALAAAAGVQN